ncbi:DUF551 domain-containing protein [Salmonella enterica]|nr:DUF551 domain-containing protein [Salmonella enterica subsp. enterica serovar Hvittingfoss]EKR1940457.1 DUF551 domain-containing protein [Salmonella enterica]
MKYSQVTTSMAKDIAFKLGAVLNDEEATIFADGYNVALLKVNKDMSTAVPNNASSSTNSPVIPGGWISCSERMPEDEQEVIVHNKLGYRYVSYFDEHSGLFFYMLGGNQMNCIEHLLVTHWRPMPAPPQQ